MTAQRRGRGDAEDEVEAVRPAEVDDLGAAIMAVGANENVRGRPVGPDRPEHTPKELAYFHAAGTLGRAQHCGHEPSVAVEHDDRLEAVFVVMGVEQTQLLAAMHGVEGIVEVKHDPLGNSGVGRAIKIDQGFSHAQKRAQIGPILKA